ncbi:hypothetical protein [Thomasclavelia saccharogumia]|uniref:hypothetical protein n=1 Tax=Thomasclavelia saccharogumia TaxID=341225 RepID=UPI00047B4E9D|nr:hypothetical protein [Thomasclavelia saccharogumia]
MKKIIVCLFSTMLFFSSYTNVSAAQLSQLEKNTVKQITNTSTKIDQTQFLTVHPDDEIINGMSVSLIKHNISAHRQDNGNVIITINETLHTVRGYYEHLATDANGENFIPNKNTAYYTLNEGISTISLNADSVSLDGYVYLKAAIAPVNGDSILSQRYYKIPVDYNNYKTTNTKSYLPLNDLGQYAPCFSAQVAFFKANATKLTDNSVEVIINVSSSNTDLWFKHLATSKDGDIFMPQKNSWYHISSDPISDKTYRLILPENCVSSDGFVYLDIFFDLPMGMSNIGSIKLIIES